MGEYFDFVIKPTHNIEMYPRMNDEDLDKHYVFRPLKLREQLKLYNRKNEDYNVVPI